MGRYFLEALPRLVLFVAGLLARNAKPFKEASGNASMANLSTHFFDLTC